MFDTWEMGMQAMETSKGEELVARLRECHRQIGHLQARFYGQLLAVADAVAEAMPAVGYQCAADEVAEKILERARKQTTGQIRDRRRTPDVGSAPHRRRLRPAPRLSRA